MNMKQHIKAFFASLLPSFERSRINEDIDTLVKEIEDTLLPSYKAASTYTKGKGFKSKLVADFNTNFTNALPQYRRAGFIDGTIAFFSEMPAKLALLDKLTLELFAKDVTKDTMTYRKAAILQYLESLRFATKYATRSLLRYVAAENAALNGNVAATDSQLSPVERKWLDDNKLSYLTVLKLLGQPVKELEALLAEIPDIAVVPERYEMLKQTIGVDKLDPLRFGLISADKNLIYHVRVSYAEWQVKNYQRDLEERRTLELRLLEMKQAYNGTQDAKLQQAIEYNEGRLQKLNFEIAKMQEQYA